jgi:hypothetical protein
MEFWGNGITPTPAPDGAQLMADLVNCYRTYVRVSEDEYVVLAAFVLHCHAFKAFARTPYLNVLSATPECGKTLLLEITELLVPMPLMASSLSNAVLSRAIDTWCPTLLLDELDQLLAGDKDLLASIMATINSGYKKSGRRVVLEPTKGGGWAVKELSTFCPKMLAGISSLPPATKSRCIPITMEKMLPRDRVEEPDEYVLEPLAKGLFSRAEAWAAANLEQLRNARPATLAELGHRQREVSRPLFAIADLVGSGWEEKVRSAVKRLFVAQSAVPADDVKILLLGDIRDVMGSVEHISTAGLIDGLCKVEESPWSTWGRSKKPINANQLARLLKDFKIYSCNIWADNTCVKGYRRSSLEPVWERYLPTNGPYPDSSRYTASTSMDSGVKPLSQPLGSPSPSGLKLGATAIKQSESSALADGNGVRGPEQVSAPSLKRDRAPWSEQGHLGHDPFCLCSHGQKQHDSTLPSKPCFGCSCPMFRKAASQPGEINQARWTAMPSGLGL